MPYILSILSGILLILCFPSFDLGWLGWISLVPLFIALDKKSPLQGFIISFLSGLVFFSGSIIWIKTFHPLALPLSVFSLSLYFGLFGSVACYFKKNSSYGISFLWAGGWTSLEYIRSLGFLGFPWFTLGYTQHKYLYLIQISQYTGIWGISFLLVLFNAALAQCLINKKLKKSFIFIIAFIAVIIFWGRNTVKSFSNNSGRELKIAVIQGNFDIYTDFPTDAILSRLVPMSISAAGQSKLDMVIWTETVILEDIRKNNVLKNNLIKFAKEIDCYVLLGNPVYQVINDVEKHFNCALLISPSGEISQYNKIHLVPFGELVPGNRKFGLIGKFAEYIGSGEYDSGEDITLLDTKKGKFGTLICFEGVFGNLARQFIKKGGDFLVNITEDDWLKKSVAGMKQHAYMSVFRAIENKTYYIRAGNSGLSFILDPNGRIIQDMPIQKEGFFVSRIYLKNSPKTFYTKYGDVFIWLVLIITVLQIVIFRAIDIRLNKL